MPKPDTSPEELEPVNVSVQVAARLIGVTPWSIYQLLNDPDCPLQSGYFGKRRLITLESVRQFANNLPTERPEVTA